MPTPSWYSVRELAPSVWGLADFGVNCYLVAGTERALLIDTGWGFSDLAATVKSLTTLPISVVHTHGHPDHVNADRQFTDIYIAAADMPIAAMPPEARRGMLERVKGRGPLPEGFDAEGWIAAPVPPMHPLEADARFALGGRTLQVIPMPGHTPGSVCLWDAGAHLLFTGDSIVAGPTLMFLEHSLSLQTYADSLSALRAATPGVESLLPGHGDPLPPSRIGELLHLATDILDGTVTGQPETTPLGEALCARTATCGICYQAARLR